MNTGKLVSRDTATNSLGANVDGFVMPMFHSQTAIAYNPALVSNPPKSYDELVAWTKANPKKFGYNGIKGGMSGVAFVFGWIYANTPDAASSSWRGRTIRTPRTAGARPSPSSRSSTTTS